MVAFGELYVSVRKLLIFTLATEHGAKSIAFPGISTGIYRFPKEVAAKIAVAEVVHFLQRDNLIDEIVFVCFDDESYDIYTRLLGDINQENPR